MAAPDPAPSSAPTSAAAPASGAPGIAADGGSINGGSMPAGQVAATAIIATLGVFVTYLPVYGVAGSLPTIAAATGADTTQLQWVVVAYVIPMAAAVLSAGVFGDLYGRRRLFALGLVLTFIGALGSGAASLLDDAATLPVLWAGQVVAGLRGGILLPTTLALIAHAVPDPRARGRYIARWAMGMTAGLAVGPVLAGVILEFADWGWIFLPSVVLSVLILVLGHLRLPESKAPEGRRLDVAGQISATLAIVALIFGVIQGGALGWASAPALTGYVVGGISAIAFIVIEWRAPSPLMRLSLFRSPSFSAAGLGAGLALFAIVGVMFLVSVQLGAAQSLSALEIGIRIVFVPGVAMLTSPLVGRLLTRISPLTVLTLGLVVGAVSVLALGFIDSTTSYLDAVWRLALFGLSNALMLPSMSAVAVNAVPVQLAGMASATNSALRQIGGAVGPAVLGSIFAVQLQHDASGASGLLAAMTTTAVLLAIGALVCVIAASVSRRSS